MNNKQIGDYGEDLAERFLTEKGYLILDRNYRKKTGEIDIVSKLEDTLIFVEVKTRKNEDFISAREAVNIQKQQRIRTTAKKYIFEKKCRFQYVRFDVIEIYTQNRIIRHFENAF